MPEIRHLRSAPITEAIIDIRVRARAGFQVAEFSTLGPGLAATFPKVKEMCGSQVSFQVSASEAKPPHVEDLGLQGYFFRTEDDKTIAQFRIDGFTLNRLKPYTSWNELRPLAEDLWDKYRSVAKPEAITRIALRYINHLEIPQRVVNFDEYLRACPQVPLELPQSVGRFLYQTSILDPADHIVVNVTQAFQAPPHDSPGIIVILDIDAFKSISITPDDPHLFEHFTSLHEMKNKVFFNYITERTIGLFQ